MRVRGQEKKLKKVKASSYGPAKDLGSRERSEDKASGALSVLRTALTCTAMHARPVGTVCRAGSAVRRCSSAGGHQRPSTELAVMLASAMSA